MVEAALSWIYSEGSINFLLLQLQATHSGEVRPFERKRPVKNNNICTYRKKMILIVRISDRFTETGFLLAQNEAEKVPSLSCAHSRPNVSLNGINKPFF